LSFSIKKNRAVSTTFFGDGATNEGGFYESINFAALHRLPVLFICENNLYSVHMTVDQCLANPVITRVVKAFNIDAKRIDGNDLRVVHEEARKAVAKIRDGRGPVFLECMTYRYRGHVGPTDNTGVGLRSKSEIDSWKERDPIRQFGRRLTEAERKLVDERVSGEIDEAVRFAESAPYPGNQVVHTDVYREIG